MAKAVFITKQGNATSVQIQDGGVTAFSYLFNEPQDLIAKVDGEHIVITEAVNYNSPSITFKFSDIDDKLSATTSHEYLLAAATAGLFFSGVSAGGGGTSYTFENGLTETDGTVTWYDEVAPGFNQFPIAEGTALTIGGAPIFGVSIALDGGVSVVEMLGNQTRLIGTDLVDISSTTEINIDSDAALNVSAQSLLTLVSPAVFAATATTGQVLTLIDEATGECDFADAGGSTGLEAIDEGNGIGWRLTGRDPANYGNIGLNAVDLSDSASASATIGATGTRSTVSGGQNNTASNTYSTVSGGNINIASGTNTTVSGGNNNAASGNDSVISGGVGNTTTGINSVVSGGNNNHAAIAYSTVAGGQANNASANSSAVLGGRTNTASGNFSTVIGGNTNTAPSYGEIAGGLFPTTYTPASATAFNAADRLFNLGNGTATGDRSDAFTVYKNGNADINGDLEVTGFGFFDGAITSLGLIKADQFGLSGLNTAPSSATDTGTEGEIIITATHIYVCSAANTWVRADLATW